MTLTETIAEIKKCTGETFAALDAWFNETETRRSYHPANGGWTVNEILEHTATTNHYLLLLINKNTEKALKRAALQTLPEPDTEYIPGLSRYGAIADAGAFVWNHLPHMAPAGKPPAAIRELLKSQLTTTLQILKKLGRGEGILCLTTLNVNGLGKTDIYGFIYFMLQHAQRHLARMRAVLKERETVKTD
jgi:DinB superfamily